MTVEEFSAQPRRRKSAESFVEQRAAKAVVQDLQVRVGRWHTEVAQLKASRIHTAERRTAVQEKASELLPTIIAARIELEQLAARADEKVRQHSLIRDLGRSLHHLREEVELIERRHSQ